MSVWYTGGRRGRDRMIVGFTITCAISAYHRFPSPIKLPDHHDNWTNCSKLDPMRKVPCSGVIYYRLFNYTQQHIAGFTENSIGPATPKACLVPKCNRYIVESGVKHHNPEP